MLIISWKIILFLSSVFADTRIEQLYGSSTVEFKFPSSAVKDQEIRNGNYIKNNCIIAGIKTFKDDVFLTVPRWRRGVPSTLNKLDINSGLLIPYPSWDFNQNSVTYVQSMEIDSKGQMWILDVGRLNIFDDSVSIINLQPRLLVWDIINNQLVKSFNFPSSVAPSNNSFLNDLVIDEEDGFVYISDTADKGGIIVFDINNEKSWRYGNF